MRLALPLQDPAVAPDWLAHSLAGRARAFPGRERSPGRGPRLLAELSALEDTIAARRFCAAVEAEEPAREARALLGNVPAAIARRSRLAATWVAAADPILQLRGFKALAEATGERGWEDRAFNTLAEMIERVTLHIRVLRSAFNVPTFNAPPSRAAARIDSAAAGPTRRLTASSGAARC